ncbi:hypothetical protein NQ318_012038 [Aromia moschata]|uniref:THAP-type domain-containing protein n=1 Tax=Aromia moschata TaxID=1265417 RepID=A0AAV8XLH8_9CUCU|nr:hypothetical protein NQ318_012038 [Aromia moschata]
MSSVILIRILLNRSVLLLFAKIGEVKLKNIAYYRLTAERNESWIQAIGRDPKENLSITHKTICSDHFTQDSHIYVDDKRVLKNLSLFGSTLQELNHISSKKKGNMSTDSEGLTGSPKRRRKFLRTFDNCAVSLRKLTKQVGDLREENKKLKQELSLKGTIKTAI